MAIEKATVQMTKDVRSWFLNPITGKFYDDANLPNSIVKVVRAEDYDALLAKAEKLAKALEWIAGKTDKPYCTYYERTLDDGTIVPMASEVAEQALKDWRGE